MINIDNNLPRFLAEIAIKPSAAMGEARKGKRGLRKAVIQFLSNGLRLNDFSVPDTFDSVLDSNPDRLSVLCSMSWGTSRKCLNIFLRDAAYNCYTRRRYALEAIESRLEVPLDKNVEQGIRRDFRRLKPPLPPLPKFENGPFSIISLTRKQHENYQKAADWIARVGYHTYRIHLDLLYFAKPRFTRSSQNSSHAATEPAAGNRIVGSRMSQS